MAKTRNHSFLGRLIVLIPSHRVSDRPRIRPARCCVNIPHLATLFLTVRTAHLVLEGLCYVTGRLIGILVLNGHLEESQDELAAAFAFGDCVLSRERENKLKALRSRTESWLCEFHSTGFRGASDQDQAPFGPSLVMDDQCWPGRVRP